MTDPERERFDALFEEALEQLPDRLRALLDEIPVVLDDRPAPELLRSMGLPEDELLCGLHTGVALTERSVEHSGVPTDVIQLFREGIIDTAGGWTPGDDETDEDVDDAVYEEIMITLLHEIGHHFGLDEDDLESLGYA